jgi:hypothetical protein
MLKTHQVISCAALRQRRGGRACSRREGEKRCRQFFHAPISIAFFTRRVLPPSQSADREHGLAPLPAHLQRRGERVHFTAGLSADFAAGLTSDFFAAAFAGFFVSVLAAGLWLACCQQYFLPGWALRLQREPSWVVAWHCGAALRCCQQYLPFSSA